MAYSYSIAHIGEDGYAVTTVRFLCGDTVPNPYSLADEEIDYLIAQQADDGYAVYNAALEAINLLQLRYATRPQSESIGDASVSWGSIGVSLKQRALWIRETYLVDRAQVGILIAGGREARFPNNAQGITG